MFKHLIPAWPVDIKNDHTTLGIQETLLLKQRYYALSQLDQANDRLDNKAVMLLQSSSLIFALIGGLQFPKIIYTPTWPVLAAIAASFLAFLAMVYLLLTVWMPGEYTLPGANDWATLHHDYLWVPAPACFTQILDDCTAAYQSLKTSNARKAVRLKWAVALFAVQITGLLTLALLSP